MHTLGARTGVLSWYITSTSQGNKQNTMHVPTQYITSTFRIFPANVPAVSLAWEWPVHSVSQITWLQCSYQLHNGNILNFPKECNCSVPEWLIQEILAVCSQCPRSCDWDVPLGKWWEHLEFSQRKPLWCSWVAHSKSFLQCSQPVKPKMSQNGVPEVNQSGTFWMCPSRQPQCTIFGKKNWGNFGKILGSFKMFPVF